MTPALEVSGLTFAYPDGRTALHGVDLRVERGRTVGVVGESGSGKSTLAKVLVGSVRAAAGTANGLGVPIAGCGGKLSCATAGRAVASIASAARGARAAVMARRIIAKLRIGRRAHPARPAGQ